MDGAASAEGTARGSSLYARALGASFGDLAPVLRAVHGRRAGFEAQGAFAVSHGAGWLRRALARLLGLPPAGDGVPMTLLVRPEGEGERWHRTFGTHVVVTRQFLRAGRLHEAMGPVSFAFALGVDRGALRFETFRARLFGLPLPGFAAPRVEALAEGRGEATWRVQVHLGLPLLGRLATYEGDVTLLGAPARETAWTR